MYAHAVLAAGSLCSYVYSALSCQQLPSSGRHVFGMGCSCGTYLHLQQQRLRWLSVPLCVGTSCCACLLQSCSRWVAMLMYACRAGLLMFYQVFAQLPLKSCAGPRILCCAVLCCAVLCCAVLCCAVLCCAVLCCAVLCCAVLCCAVLC
jgi:hypothetical protein